MGPPASEESPPLPKLDDFDDLDITSELPEDFDSWESNIDEHLSELLGSKESAVMEQLEQGKNLREYAEKLEQDMLDAQNLCIDEHVCNAEGIATLIEEIAMCEHLLEATEDVISAFRERLSDAAKAVEQVQGRTTALNLQHRNRKEVLRIVHDVVMELESSQALLAVYGPRAVVDDPFINDLAALSQRAKFVTECPALQGGPSQGQLIPQLQAAIARACEKLVGYVTQQLEKRVNVSTSLQGLKASEAAMAGRCQKCFEFLAEHSADTASRVRRVYAQQMARFFRTHFKAKIEPSEKREIVSDWVPVIPESMFDQKKRFTLRPPSFLGKKDTQVPPVRERLLVLASMNRLAEMLVFDPTVLPPVTPAQVTFSHTYATIGAELVNFVMHESEFVMCTLAADHDEVETIVRVYLGPPLDLWNARFMEYLGKAADVTEVLLLIRFNTAFLKIHDAKVDSSRTLFERTSSDDSPLSNSYKGTKRRQKETRVPAFLREMLLEQSTALWDKFHALFDLHLAGLTAAAAIPFPSHPWYSQRSPTSDMLANADIRATLQAHPSSQRYAEFAGNVLLVLCQHCPAAGQAAFRASPIQTELVQMAAKMHRLLSALAKRHGSAALECIFLILNYSAILRVFASLGLPMDNEECKRWTAMRQEQIQCLVTVELTASPLAKLQKLGDSGAEHTNGFTVPAPAASHVADLEAVVTDCNANWRLHFEQVNLAMQRLFSDPAILRPVLEVAFTAVLKMYTRLRHKIQLANQFCNPPLRLVADATIVPEIRRYLELADPSARGVAAEANIIP